MLHSSKLLLALEAVLDIAYHAGGELVLSSEITRRQGIPRHYLDQTLQQLVRAGVLTSVRGPHGGYRLARERRRISVAEVVRVVRLLESREAPAIEIPTSEIGRAIVRPLWDLLTREIMARLDTITIDTLCEQAHKTGIA